MVVVKINDGKKIKVTYCECTGQIEINLLTAKNQHDKYIAMIDVKSGEMHIFMMNGLISTVYTSCDGEIKLNV